MKQNIKLKGRLRNYMYWPMILTILLLLINIPVYMINVKSGFVVSGFTVVYFIVVVSSYNYNKPVLLNELITFATQYGSVQKKLLEEFEIPYALLDEDGKILWLNQQFSKITGKEKTYHKTVNGIFPALTKELLQKKDEIRDLSITMDERFYRIHLKKMYFDTILPENGIVSLDKNKDYLNVLYLFDETDLKKYIKENEEQRLVASLVYIDNYDEVLDSVEDVKRSLLEALIERKVNRYFSNVDALVRKIEKDKYFVVFKHKYLEELEKDKFSLIEEVKTIKVGNEMAATLSIGIGYNSGTYNQNYEYARAAIDLALGRGGDQVVIKEREQITYYGGKSQKVEKNTRVKARVKAEALRELIESKEQIFIMGHRIADVDSFGAAIGICCAARVLDKTAYIVLDEVTTSLRPIRDCFTEENGYPNDLCINSETALYKVNNKSLVMVVDTNRPNYTECPELLKKTKTIVVFDHHRQTSDVVESPTLSYIEPYASSTCEMIAEVLQYFTEKIKLEPREADAIYAGILIDTNNFMSNTGVRTFEAAAYLRRCGAEVTRVRKLLRDDMDAYKARAEVVRHAEVYYDHFAISVCPADNIKSPTIVGAQAANELLNIVGIKASFVLTPYQGKIYISSRSIDEINVQLIMERLGGGGHLNVAGAQLTDCSIEKAKWMIQDTLEEMLKEGDIE
ncbi:MAG: DHH family phosphoesterase [Lachnospiraceae bacterium]|nr:DHH family phosphoesterase [Lachnospiraceae bacterium]